MSELVGGFGLARLIVRRDGVVLVLWMLLAALPPIAIAASFAELYPTAEARRLFADESMQTPAAVALLGLVFGPTLGGLTAWRSGLQSAFLIALPSLLLVIRHTRAEEEAGRRELLGSTVVGRHAALAAALGVACAANLIIAILIAAGLIGLGLPAPGSVDLGLSAAAGGIVFAAVAGVAAQLTQSPAAARGIAFAFFGVCYLLRIVGDLRGGEGGLFWLSWLSPLGWMRFTRAFAGEQWWVFGLFGALIVALVALAHALSARRDLGAGLLPPRPGPATAGRGLRSPLALAWRLHRGSLLAWTTGFAVLGVSMGAVSRNLSTFMEVPQFRDWSLRMGTSEPDDAFLFLLIYVASAYAMMAALRLRAEEVGLRAEPVLSAPVERLRWAGGHRWALAIFLILELFWELRQVSQSVFDVSPFAHVHWAVQPTAEPLFWLVALAASLGTLGLIGLTRRDLG